MVNTVHPKSRLGIAINYTLSLWDRLVVYTTNPNIPIDTNLVENTIRPFVVGRRNDFFQILLPVPIASSILYTFIENAKVIGLEPYYYLRYLF